MNVPSISPSTSAASGVPTLVASQQEALKEVQANVQDGDENVGATINTSA